DARILQPFDMRRSGLARRTAVWRNERLTLMPFLDVVTATIGVFLLIFAVQVIQAVVENRQLQPDQIIVCSEAENWSLFTGPRAAEQRFERWEKDRMLETIIASSNGITNVVLAIGPECDRGAHEISRLVQNASHQVPT